uniref:Zinc-ribbon domain-containing protein n=1 Tax=Thermogemmatispora argillosa TaxID=2045280 RepID=A0A455SXP2_9CHLR|nr:hypothetical protein KTA_06290 [Thermogemmatispora argillosa]
MESSSRFCPNCGTPLFEKQAFCSMCGTALTMGAGEATLPAGAEGSAGSAESTPTTAVPPQPPPPPLSSNQPDSDWFPAQFSSQQPSGSGHQQSEYIPPPPPPSYGQQGAPLPSQPDGVPPPYARPQQNAGRGVIAGLGCGMLLVILLIVLVCGALGLGGYLFLRNLASATTTAVSSSSSHTSGSSGGATSRTKTPTSIPTRTFAVNGTLTYSSITITVVNAQLASRFPDDAATSDQTAVLRLTLKENNATANFPLYFYSDSAHLILPDQSSISVSDVQYNGAPNPNTTRTNWLDFPVPPTVDVSRTILRLGAPGEAKMDIPLQNNPDLSKYQPVTTKPTNAQTTYAGLKWTVTETTVSWSYNGKQAESGKRFLILSFRIDNPSSRDVFFDVNDFMRLQVGSDRSAPIANTLNGVVNAGTTNHTGVVVFALPEGTTSCTLIMMPVEVLPNSQQTQISLALS